MRRLDTSPKKDGFRMPGEFETHRGTYMIWPERPDNWRYGGKYAQKAFTQVAGTISRYEPLTMLVSSGQYENARNMLPHSVRVAEASSDDCWARDTGPTFVVNDNGILRGVDWAFNSWGGLYDGLYFPWNRDDQIAQKICELENADSYRLDDFVLEGGSIHVDGEGTVLVTEACLLSPGRNPGMTKAQIENKLKEYLNAEKVIWLPNGIYLDETNEHIDNICCFVRPGVTALAWTGDTGDPQYAFSKSCYDTLMAERDAKGRSLEVHKVLLPKPLVMTEEESEGVDSTGGAKPRRAGDRLAASYINFYICNGAVIMPGFNDPADAAAKETVQKLFPDRAVVQIYTREILLGGGNIHCITQQTPLAPVI
jgi:agmatine deiminase